MLHPQQHRFVLVFPDEKKFAALLPELPVHLQQALVFHQSPVYLPVFLQVSVIFHEAAESHQEVPDQDVCSRLHSLQLLAHNPEPKVRSLFPEVLSFSDKASETSDSGSHL